MLAVSIGIAGWSHGIRPPLTLLVNNVRHSSAIEIGPLEREANLGRGITIIRADV